MSFYLPLLPTDPKVIAVSKTFKEQDILPLLDYGHIDFGENKVQEALLKWPKLKEKYKPRLVRYVRMSNLILNNKNLEEIFENKEQIEVSKFYEKLPKAHAIAIDNWLTEKIYHRKPEQEK